MTERRIIHHPPAENRIPPSSPLSVLQPGERGIVRHMQRADSGVRQRLLEIGLVNGAVVEFVRVAPLGDPIGIRVDGTNVSLRKAEAAFVLVEKF